MRLLRSGRLPDAAAPGAVSASDGSIAAGAFSKIATGGSVIADPHLSPGTQTYLKAAVPGDGHGATVELTTVLLPPVRRPRAGPPNRPSRVFGRDDALATLEGAIAARVPIVVAGELGAGKTTLVDAALNGPAAGAVDDGIVQIPGALAGMVLTVDEIAQRLFDSLWDSSPNQRRIDAASAPSALGGCHPLLVLDGLHLGVDEQGAVARIVPGSAVVITSDALPLGGDGDFVVVGALPRADAARLLAERARIAGPVPTDVLDRAAALLQDWPGAITTLADLVKAGRVTMEAAVARMEAADVPGDSVPEAAYERILAVIDATFPRSEVALLETVAGLAGVSVREELADRVAGVPPGTSAGLLAAGVVWRASPRLSMDPGLRQALRRSATHQGTQDALGRLAREPDLLVDTAGELDPRDVPDAVLALRMAHRVGDLPAISRLSRALDAWLFANRLWDARVEALQLADSAAGVGGDAILAGWAAHELGTDAFLRGRLDVAGHELERAAKWREGVDPEGLARTREVLETLRIVTAPPPPWWRAPGRGPIIAAVVGAAIVGAVLVTSGAVNAIQGFIAGPTPTEAPTVLVTAQPTQPPVTPSPTPTLAAFEVLVGLVDGAVVQPTGDWTGQVTVTPTGGLPPYAYDLNVGRRSGAEPETFDVSGIACRPAVLEGTVGDAQGAQKTLNEPVLPVACNDYAAPSAPALMEPADGTVLYRNCRQTPVGFVWSAGTGDAATWQMQVEVFQDSTWRPLANPTGLAEPRTSLDMPCASAFRWVAAGLSSAGWLGASSAPAGFLIAPTDIPVLVPPTVQASCASVPLTWSVGRADGIAAYEIQIIDHKTEITTPMSTTTAPFDFSPTSCDAKYTWTVTSIDTLGGRGEPSEPDTFYMPPPVGLSAPRG